MGVRGGRHGGCRHVGGVGGGGLLVLLLRGLLGVLLLVLLLVLGGVAQSRRGLLRRQLLLTLLTLVKNGLVDDNTPIGAGGGGVWRQHLGVFVGANAAPARVARTGGGVFAGRRAALALDVERLVFAGLAAMQTLGGGAALGLDADQGLLRVRARRHSVASDASLAGVFDSFDDYHGDSGGGGCVVVRGCGGCAMLQSQWRCCDAVRRCW